VPAKAMLAGFEFQRLTGYRSRSAAAKPDRAELGVTADELPEWIGRLQNLTSLDLGSNQLTRCRNRSAAATPDLLI